MHFLGLDIGTTTIAACLCDESMHVVHCARQAHNATLVGQDFEALQDTSILWRVVSQLLEALPTNIRIDGIGIANQMHGIVYVTEDGSALSPLYTWQDARGAQAYCGTTYTQHVAEVCGHHVPSGYGLMTHYYNVVNGNVPKNTQRILDIGNFIASKMSGVIPATLHPSQAHAFGFYHASTQSFDTHALETLGIDSALLPKVTETCTPLGYRNTIPIYEPLGDNQAGFLGATAGDEEAVLVNIGTSGQVSFIEHAVETRSKDADKETCAVLLSGWERRPFVGGKQLYVASSLCAGKSIALWVDFVAELVQRFCGKEGKSNDDALRTRIYHALKALSYEECDLQFNTQFYGSRTKPHAKASLENICEHNFSFRHISIALMQGIADELYEFWKALSEDVRKKKRRLCLTGGAFAIPAVQEIFTKRFALERTSLLSHEAQGEDACVGAARWACSAQAAGHERSRA